MLNMPSKPLGASNVKIAMSLFVSYLGKGSYTTLHLLLEPENEPLNTSFDTC
jgi:hypothetical protein